MLLATLLFFYAFVLSYVLGMLCLKWLYKSLNTAAETIPFALANLLGMVFISVALALYHFFSKIDLWPHVFFVALVSVNFRTARHALQQLLMQIRSGPFVFAALLLVVVISLAARPGTGDIADYHLQAIKWAELYPNIPGIGNFNRPLSTNYWWFNLQAFWGFGFLIGPTVYVGNALIFFCTFVFLLSETSRHTLLHVFRLVFAAFTALATKTAFVGSVTPDFAVTCFIIICSYLFFQHFYEKKNYQLYLIIVLAIFAITVKINSLLLCLPALLVFVELVRQNNKPKTWLVFAGIACLILIPWLAGNVIASGWLLYPVKEIDLFSFDWKIPVSAIDFERLSIREYAKVPYQDIHVTAQMTFSQWFPLWLGTFDVFNKALLCATALACIWVPVYLLLKKERAVALVYLSGIVGVAYCFGNGPHIRYAYGYLLLLTALGIATLADLLVKKSVPDLKKILLLLAIIPCLLIAKKMIAEHRFAASLLKPLPYPSMMEEKTEMNGFTFYITSRFNKCWDTFPCSPSTLKGCEMRGQKIEQGFRVADTELH